MPRRSGPMKAARRVVNRIATVIKHRNFKEAVDFSVTEVFKGGSMGQGTAVPHHYDIDLVLYSKEWHEKVSRKIDEQKRGGARGKGLKEALDGMYLETLTKIERYLSQKLGHPYTLDEIRGVAIKFQYSIPEGGKLSVDLLLSPHFESKEKFCQFLRKVEPPIERLRFSVTASKWQTEFIKNQPMRVKELIRRAKYWRNRVWKDDEGKNGKPKSYLISLLVITAYHQLRAAQHSLSFRALAKQVGDRMIVLVKELADKRIPSLSIPGAQPSLLDSYADMLPDTPRIVDPVNPANNVYLSGVGPDPYGVGDNDWRTFKRRVANGIDLTQHPG